MKQYCLVKLCNVATSDVRIRIPIRIQIQSFFSWIQIWIQTRKAWHGSRCGKLSERLTDRHTDRLGWIVFVNRFGFRLVGFAFRFKEKLVDSDLDSDSWEMGWIRIRDARIRTSLVATLSETVLPMVHSYLESNGYVGLTGTHFFRILWNLENLEKVGGAWDV